MLKYLFIVLVAAYAVCVATNIVFRVKKGGIPALFVKTATSMLFVLLSITEVSMKQENYRFGIFLVIGAIFGMLGDIILDLNSMYESNNVYLMAGMASYSFGHIFYVIGILSAYVEYIPWQIVLALVCATGVSVIFKLISGKFGVDYGKLGGLTLGYSIITMLPVTFSLNAMNAFGVLPLIATGEAPDVMPRFVTMFIATAMFAISDLVLSVVYFRDGEDKKFVALNYALYYTSQFIMSLSILM